MKVTAPTALFIYAIIFGLISCSSTPEGEKTKPKYSFEKVSPEAVGLVGDSLKKVDALLQTAVDSQWVAGAVVLVAKESKIVFENTYGMRDIATGAAMKSTDLFRIASMTKPITTVAILQLYERGLLDFNDRVAKYIPEFADLQILENVNADSSYQAKPAVNELTIHHLLTHTSGIAYGFIDTLMNKLYAKAGIIELTTLKPTTLEDNIAALASIPIKHEPGEKWTYGLSIDVLGRIVEVASGQSFDAYLKENIFEPLGMENTAFYFDESYANRLTTMYGNHPEKKLVPFPEQPERDMTGSFPIMGAKSYFSGGGGLVSNAYDYLRFTQMILNDGKFDGKTLLKSETIRHMKENKIGELRVGRDYFTYGFMLTAPDGDLRMGRTPGRLSWGGAFQTTFWIDQQRNSVALLLTQVYPSFHQQKLYPQFETAVNSAFIE